MWGKSPGNLKCGGLRLLHVARIRTARSVEQMAQTSGVWLLVSRQIGQSGELSSVGELSVAVHATDRAAALGFLRQVLSGYAMFLPFVLLSSGRLQNAEATWIAMSSALLLIGVGAGFPLHSWMRRVVGLRAATRLGLVSTAIGVMTATDAATPWGILLSCLLIGLGLFGEWTPSAELTRRSLSSTQLWQGMRIHSAMYFVGALLVVMTARLETTGGLVTAGYVVALMCLANAVLLRRDPPAEASHSHVSSLEATAASEAQTSQTSPADSRDGQPDDCDAEECCGGDCEWTPMPVLLGACLTFVGMYTIGVILAGAVAQSSGSVAVIGGLVGVVMFQAVVPTTGYAVLLVPCCLLGTVVFGLAPWIGATGQGLLLSIQGGVAAAIYCGCSGLAGESFADSCQGNSRTVVLMIGSMAAAAVGLIHGVVETSLSATTASLMNGAICLVAILFLRRIPSLLVSQRRQDEVSSEEARELVAETFGAAGGSLE